LSDPGSATAAILSDLSQAKELPCLAKQTDAPGLIAKGMGLLSLHSHPHQAGREFLFQNRAAFHLNQRLSQEVAAKYG
jgi:hypothetical protein